MPNTKYFKICDIKILLDIPYEERKQRALKRDNISDYEFDLREKASIDYSNEIFDYVVKTNDSNILRKVEELI